MVVIAGIPARFASRRFPGKPLALIDGVPLVVRVVQAVRQSGVVDGVVVATDDRRIAERVEQLGVRVYLSQHGYRSGSDRLAAALAGQSAEIVLNVQADEALVDRAVLQAALLALDRAPEVAIGTVARPLREDERDDPNTVKVRFDRRGRAQAFGRRIGDPRKGWAHVGVYAFRRWALDRFASLPSSPEEKREDLEQLRAMDHGLAIQVEPVEAALRAVDCPADLARVEALLLDRDRRPLHPG